MSRAEDLSGRRFGMLVAKSLSHMSSNGTAKWLCECDCGSTKVVFSTVLRRGTSCCGCQTSKRISVARTTHGLTLTPTYRSWRAMKARCRNPKSPDFDWYGGRGILVCDRWFDSFEAFLDDMGEHPPGLTLDRSDNSGDYEPDNCVWSTAKEQTNNKRPRT
jgi:hypothetical protein